MQWFTRGLRDGRKDPGWFPALANRTGRRAGALTVAGQWRSFTAFPSILAIAVLGCAALFEDSRYGMEEISMPTMFIDGAARRSQNERGKEVCRVTKKFYRVAKQKGMVTPGRLELPTRSIGNCCSIYLSYGAVLDSIAYGRS